MKRKINIDRKMPSPKAVGAKKDFDGLLAKHQAITERPRYNNFKWITGFMLIILVAALVFQTEQEVLQDESWTMDMVDPEYTIINPQQPNKITFQSGTILDIPANAFVDSIGNVIKEEVKLSVTDYKNPVDILNSNIPMNIEVDGQQAVFESAGMIKVSGATADGTAVQIAEGKSIDVSLLSAFSQDFSLYRFDSANNKWEPRGTDMAMPAAPMLDTTGAVIATIPSKVDSNLFQFSLSFPVYDVESDSIAPAKSLDVAMGESSANELLFQVAPTAIDTHIFDLEYDHFDMKKIGLSEIEITLHIYPEKVSFKAEPCAEGNAWEEQYQQYMTNYGEWVRRDKLNTISMLREASALEVGLKDSIGSVYEKMKKAAAIRDSIRREQTRVQDSIMNRYLSIQKADQAFRRSFKIDQMGIWNCDNPHLRYMVNSCPAVFVNDNGEQFAFPEWSQINQVYLSFNGVLRQNFLTVVKWNDGSPTMIIAPIDSNNVALVKYESFDQDVIQKKGGLVAEKMPRAEALAYVERFNMMQ